jgi:hypothetical protein
MSGVVHGKGGRFKRKVAGADRELGLGEVPEPFALPEGFQLPSLEGLPGVTIEVFKSEVKGNHRWGVLSGGRGNMNKYRTRLGFRVHDSSSGVVQSKTYTNRPALDAAIAQLRAARGVALGAGGGVAAVKIAGGAAGGSPAVGVDSGAAATPPKKRYASSYVMVSTNALVETITSRCANCGAQGAVRGRAGMGGIASS